MEYLIISAFCSRFSEAHKIDKLNKNISKYFGNFRINGTGLWHNKWYDIQISHHLFYHYTSLQMRRRWNWRRFDRLLSASKIFPAETCSDNSGRCTGCYHGFNYHIAQTVKWTNFFFFVFFINLFLFFITLIWITFTIYAH